MVLTILNRNNLGEQVQSDFHRTSLSLGRTRATYPLNSLYCNCFCQRCIETDAIPVLIKDITCLLAVHAPSLVQTFADVRDSQGYANNKRVLNSRRRLEELLSVDNLLACQSWCFHASSKYLVIHTNTSSFQQNVS